MDEQRVGAYKVLMNFGVELRFKLDQLGFEAKVGDTVKDLVEAYAEGIKSGRVDIPSLV